MEAEITEPSFLPADFTRTPDGGLTQEEAARRQAQGLGNKKESPPGKSVPQILLSCLLTPFNLLNFAIALCLAAVHAWKNMLFLGVVFSNTIVGTVQELRSARLLRQLRLENTSPVTVLRGGKEIRLDPSAIVPGDLLILHAGDQVPADCLLLAGEGAADESSLTGESDAVGKKAGDLLLSGSIVNSGSLKVQAVRMGQDTAFGQTVKSAKARTGSRSVLLKELNRILGIVSVLLVPLGILLFLRKHVFQGMPLEQTVTSSAASMIGMIPEGLVLLTSAALTLGIIRLARKRVLVQELHGIENLSGCDVLCLDKTGTLTTGELCVLRTIPAETSAEELDASLRRFAAAFMGENATMRAVRAAFPGGTDCCVHTVPFSSETKRSCAVYENGRMLVLGAPEFLLEKEVLDAYRPVTEPELSRGLRVLLFAESEYGKNDRPPDVRPLGFLVLRDTLRDNAKDTIGKLCASGISIRLFSGDNPQTVGSLALQAGLAGAENTADASLLKTPEAFREAVLHSTVIGRMRPAQKAEAVEILREAGYRAAMIGDGINDIPAMKAADCSIAVGGACDAVRNTAMITLLQPDFSLLSDIFAEGGQVVGNITRTASLFLTKTLFSFLLTLLFLFLPAAYPFSPFQLTLLSTCTIGIPAFLLTLEPCSGSSRGFLARVLRGALPGAVSVTACAVFYAMSGRSDAVLLCLLSAGFSGLLTLLLICLPLTPYRLLVCGGMTFLFFGACTLFPHFFDLPASADGAAPLLCGLFAASAVLQLAVRLLLRKAEKP